MALLLFPIRKHIDHGHVKSVHAVWIDHQNSAVFFTAMQISIVLKIQ